MPNSHQDMGRLGDHQKSPHLPVLLSEVLQYLSPKAGESYLDLTAGFGGHTAAMLEHSGSPDKAVLVDRDRQAVKYLKKRFKDATIIHSDYLSASRRLLGQGKFFDMILADLGVSSLHLDDPVRGFSFGLSGPLDMRMDAGQSLSADEIVNHQSQKELEKILREYGEEPKAAKLARAIVAARPIGTTKQLAAVISRTAGRRRPKSRVHPATRSFQALRIAVNGELDQLEQSLPLWKDLLAPGGRLAVVSFHSLEDRIVKRFLAESAGGYDAELKILTKKPISAQKTEIVSNPRARSAKLRAAAKIKI